MSGSIYDGRRFFPVDSTPRIKKFASFDTEDDTKGNVLLVTFHDGETPVIFRKIGPALEFIYNLALTKPLYLTAHNLEYDLCNLFQGRLHCLEWRFFGGKLMSAKILGTRITCWDSLNHSYHSPLAALGDSIGLPKLESDYSWTRGRKLSEEDIAYAVRDVEIVQRYMEEQQVLYFNIGAEMKTTTPATAMDFWRRHYLKESIAAVSEPVRRFFKQGYYGGRVEIFRMRSEGHITYVDINSLYPTVMQFGYPDIDNLKRDGRFGMVEATVDIPQMHIPPLPVRAQGKLMFPVGTVRGVWCTCELEYAISCGVHVRQVHNLLGSRETIFPFLGYVTECYEARLKSRSFLEKTMWKFLMNGLYGKFGTDGQAQHLVDPATIPKSELTGREFYVGDLLCVDVETEPAAYANILWAAWTTALARIRLHRALVDCERSGGEVLYCDTDSVIFKAHRRKGRLSFLEIGNGLGQWKVEAEIRRFSALAPKVYQYETADGLITRAKGVPRDVQEAFYTDSTATYRKPLRMREAARRGLSPNLWVDTKKTLKTGYDKRIVTANGKTCPPVAERGGG